MKLLGLSKALEITPFHQLHNENDVVLLHLVLQKSKIIRLKTFVTGKSDVEIL